MNTQASAMPSWLWSFVDALLEGRKEVVSLLAKAGNPFSEQPPKYIRVLLYDYHFSSPLATEASKSASPTTTSTR